MSEYLFAGNKTKKGLGLKLRSQSMHGLFGWTEIKMASIANDSKLSETKEEGFILTEDDIPWAVLPNRNVEACSVVQLKRWLICRGAKTSGKKSALVSR